MEKIKTTIRIAGKEFAITSTDTEEHVQNVAAWVDRKMRELNEAAHLSGNQLAILTAVNAVDDMMKSREEIRRMRKQLTQLQEENEHLKQHEKG